MLIDSLQIVEYAFVPANASSASSPTSDPLTWYTGDVYAFGATPSGQASTKAEGPSNYARAIALPPGEYIVLTRALYECRMFGDPGDKPPTIKMTFRVFLDDDGSTDDSLGSRSRPPATILHGLTVVPGLLDGWAMGLCASVAVRVPPLTDNSGDEESGAVIVTAEGYGDGLTLGTMSEHLIAPGQTRSIPLLLAQLEPTGAKELEIVINVTRGERQWQLGTRLPLKHVSSRSPKPLIMTFTSPAPLSLPALVSAAVVIPPSTPSVSADDPPPVLLALHGAGVPTPSDEWNDAMPNIPGMWAVLPSGRTEWGEDWHGGSLADVWGARDALPIVVERTGLPTPSSETLLIGHSNGGQGAWHAAARYPDRIRGVIAVAGYTKIQDYVPYTELTGAHYADPALLGILSAALTPYNNDLYASNLASVPVLAVHGAEDDNVPPRHGRAQCAIVAAWSSNPAYSRHADVQFVEVPHVGHVWDGVLRHPAIMDFIASPPPQREVDEVRRVGFTLATANPQECGGKAGIRIAELAVPGRLARLDVNARQWCNGRRGKLDLHGTNVRRVEITGWAAEAAQTQSLTWSKTARAFVTAPTPALPRAYGPMIRLLASVGPLVLVTASSRARAIATRYAHHLRVYHRLDTVMMSDKEALLATADGSLALSNIVVIGGPEENSYAEWMMAQEGVPPVKFPTRGVMTVDGRLVWEEGTGASSLFELSDTAFPVSAPQLTRPCFHVQLTPGIITLLPHPATHTTTALACLVAGNDALGLELAARLLPLRTGVPVPDWAVVSPRMKWQAAGGMIGAGFWSAEWGWSEAMSWFDRE